MYHLDVWVGEELLWQQSIRLVFSCAGSITQIAVSEESVEEGIEWNSAMTAAVTMATDEGIKKDPEEISGWSFPFLCTACILFSFPLHTLERRGSGVREANFCQ